MEQTLAGNRDGHSEKCIVPEVAVSNDALEHGLDGSSVSSTNPHGMKRELNSRHVQLIGLGGCIGTGLFIGSGAALARAGPVGALLGYLYLSSIVWAICQCLGEMTTWLPLSGGLPYFATRYVSQSLGFAVGWNNWIALTVIVSVEITAGAVVIEYWTSSIPVAVWITVMYLVVVALNMATVRWFGETEFWFASIKVITIFSVIIALFVIAGGHGPDHRARGFILWSDPINTFLVPGHTGRFLAWLSTLIQAAFSFGFGPELINIASGETKNPRRNVPRAIRRFQLYIIAMYMLSILAIGLTVPRSDARLLHVTKEAKSTAAASPFVIALENSGVQVFPHVINAAILSSAWSSACSVMYSGARILNGMAQDGFAPRVFIRCTSWGIPIYSIALMAVLGLLSFMSVSRGSSRVFVLLANITSITSLLSWIGVAVTSIRFKMAANHQHVDLRKNCNYAAPLGLFTPYYALLGCVFIALVQGFYLFFPGQWDPLAFATAYCGIVAFLATYMGHWFACARHEPWLRPLAEIDLFSKKQEFDELEQRALADAATARPPAPWYIRVVDIVL